MPTKTIKNIIMIDKPLFGATMILLILGLIMSYSLSSYAVIKYGYNDMHFFLRQFIAIVIGVILLVGLSKLDPDKWFKPIAMIIFLVFLTMLLIMPLLPETLVKSVGGAKRWINLGAVSLTPVEFYKVGFIMFISWSLVRTRLPRGKMSLKEEIKIFVPYIIVLIVSTLLIAVFQKDLGQTLVLSLTLTILFLLVGSSFRFFSILAGLGIGSFVILIITQPHRIKRIQDWFLSFGDEVNRLETYQISNSIDAIRNGGYFGQGLGNGQYKLGHLSEVNTDFILAGIAEELGFITIIFVTFIMFFIIFRIFKIAAKVDNPIYYLYCVGAALLITFSFLINSFGISGITPIKGIAVPFLSYGGSQVIASALSIGIVLMISKKVERR
ncbi:MAG: Cell division protein FtsW [uncultured Sulfurovum sp.]|uniref:Probable peptidoglycan glycosyltransferase FtsW n=1 Tax=uncultured Sulfurovum sp. TaxID=269237 RepID=A0A6S6TKX7_9BACT|nr:MAG: Cell division protein FtsW [uncultured Sulfurovum sp.]